MSEKGSIRSLAGKPKSEEAWKPGSIKDLVNFSFLTSQRPGFPAL